MADVIDYKIFGDELQLVVIGHRDRLAIDRWLIALVIERQHRHPVKLRERIVELRLDDPVRKQHAPAAGAAHRARD